MTTYTLTINEAETQLRRLVQQTQTTHQPVVLTGEETAEPLVVMVESQRFETLRRRERQLFHLQLQQLLRLLDDTKLHWLDKSATQTLASQVAERFTEDFRASIQTLWELCSLGARKLCSTLRIASNRLAKESLTRLQIETLRECVELLRFETPSNSDIEYCYRKLIACGLPPMITGDATLVQMYVDEL